jgi:cell division protein FtsL
MVAAASAHVRKDAQSQTRRSAGARSPARRPELRVVTPVHDARHYVVLLLLVAALGVFGVVSLNAFAAESAFAAQKLEREVAALSVRYEELTAEVASLQAPSRVYTVAVERLGMVPADEPGYLLITQGQPADGTTQRGVPLMSVPRLH